MAEQPSQILLGALVFGPLSDEEIRLAARLHNRVLKSVYEGGNLTPHDRANFISMCQKKEFSAAYGLLRDAFGSQDSITTAQMQEWSEWHALTERGFAPTQLRPA